MNKPKGLELKEKSLERRPPMGAIIILLSLLLVGCVTSPARVTYQPFKDPAAYTSHVNAAGVIIAVEPIFDKGACKKHFGTDLRKVGFSAIRLVVRNETNEAVEIDSSQIFLKNPNGLMVSAVPMEIASKRLARSHIMGGTAQRTAIWGAGGAASGAVLGAALGALSGQPGMGAAVGSIIGAGAAAGHGAVTAKEKRYELRWDSDEEFSFVMWRSETAIPPKTLTHGYVFFPAGQYVEAFVTFRTHPSGWTPTFTIPLR